MTALQTICADVYDHISIFCFVNVMLPATAGADERDLPERLAIAFFFLFVPSIPFLNNFMHFSYAVHLSYVPLYFSCIIFNSLHFFCMHFSILLYIHIFHVSCP